MIFRIGLRGGSWVGGRWDGGVYDRGHVMSRAFILYLVSYCIAKLLVRGWNRDENMLIYYQQRKM